MAPQAPQEKQRLPGQPGQRGGEPQGRLHQDTESSHTLAQLSKKKAATRVGAASRLIRPQALKTSWQRWGHRRVSPELTRGSRTSCPFLLRDPSLCVPRSLGFSSGLNISHPGFSFPSQASLSSLESTACPAVTSFCVTLSPGLSRTPPRAPRPWGRPWPLGPRGERRMAVPCPQTTPPPPPGREMPGVMPNTPGAQIPQVPSKERARVIGAAVWVGSAGKGMWSGQRKAVGLGSCAVPGRRRGKGGFQPAGAHPPTVTGQERPDLKAAPTAQPLRPSFSTKLPSLIRPSPEQRLPAL